MADGVKRSRLRFAQHRFELGEELLDRIEIRRVLGQEQEMGAGLADSRSDRLSFVRSQIVGDDDVVWLERGDERLLDIGAEYLAVDGAIEQAGRLDPVVPQSGDEGRSFPMAVRDFGDQARAASCPAAHPCHVGLGPRLVDEDEARGINPPLVLAPAGAVTGDVGAVLLARDSVFF